MPATIKTTSTGRAQTPIVSVVIAVHNDAEYVQRAIRSALNQTESRIEVICVDDGSTDQTPQLIEAMLMDQRLKLIRMRGNHSAYQARRRGVGAATAPHVMFLDGDDELVPSAVEAAITRMRASSADVVGFGVKVVMPDGQGPPRFERDLQPRYEELLDSNIIEQLFPKGAPAQGHLWKYLFDKQLLSKAYVHADSTLKFYRANDIPVSFLALSFAQKYVSIKDRLYLYYFKRGTSGQAISKLEDFEFYLSAMDAIASIENVVPDHAAEVYASAKRSMIANLVRDCWNKTSGELQSECMTLLVNKVGALAVILASADFFRAALPMLITHFSNLPVKEFRNAESVVVTTAHLQTGGLRGVLASQVHHLLEAQIDVTVALHKREESDEALIPNAKIQNIEGQSWADKILCYLDICAANQADAIIDHHILYDEYWPFYSLAARTIGVTTIGWIHSFSLRPIFNGTSRLSFMMAAMPTLGTVVVLSPTDVAFWSMSGASNAVYLPNPPSPLLLNSRKSLTPKRLTGGAIKLLWWGRLEQSTKQVRELLKVAAELKKQDIDFQLRIVGPDGPDLTASILRREVYRAGLSDSVTIVGPLYDRDLENALDDSDIVLMTSAIEGYPLTLVEAQSHGVPVIMYELPWLAYAKDNSGVFTVPQSSPKSMADTIALLVRNRDRYSQASISGIKHAKFMLDLDFKALYRDLLEGNLTGQFRPNPTLEDQNILLRLSVMYAERTARTLGRSKTEVRKLRSELSSVQEESSSTPSTTTIQAASASKGIPDIENFKAYRRRSTSRLRALLSRIIPGSWRQANYIAERQARWNELAFKSLSDQQTELNRNLLALQKVVDRLGK